eukprot:5415650-Karenia_brevis.AAC.1
MQRRGRQGGPNPASPDQAGRYDLGKVTTQKLDRHQNSKLHQGATREVQITGKENLKLENLPGMAGSPTHAEYLDLIKAATSQHSHAWSTLASSHKRAAMMWTLAEAQRDVDRSYLKKAVSICLTQDASKGKLLVNVSASCAKLERRSAFKTIIPGHAC